MLCTAPHIPFAVNEGTYSQLIENIARFRMERWSAVWSLYDPADGNIMEARALDFHVLNPDGSIRQNPFYQELNSLRQLDDATARDRYLSGFLGIVEQLAGVRLALMQTVNTRRSVKLYAIFDGLKVQWAFMRCSNQQMQCNLPEMASSAVQMPEWGDAGA
jgi:hypothetical protein